jgi:hypothetical protein
MVKASLATVYTAMMIEAAPQLAFNYPEGIPEFVTAGRETTFVLVLEEENAATVVPGSAKLHYSIGGVPYVTQPLTETGPNQFLVTLPPVACANTLEFFFSAEEAQTGDYFDGGVDDPYSSKIVTEFTVTFRDEFEADQGWTVASAGASAGFWERGVPVNDPDWDYDPESDGDGSGQCFVTGNQFGDSDVDEGGTYLLSPVIDMTQGGEISYEYYLYISNEDGGWDRLQLDVNNSAGDGEWTQVALHNTNGLKVWHHHVVTESDLAAAGVTLTSEMVFRFLALDLGAESIVEAGVDGFTITNFDCTTETPAKPVLLSPADGSVVEDLRPEFI